MKALHRRSQNKISQLLVLSIATTHVLSRQINEKGKYVWMWVWVWKIVTYIFNNWPIDACLSGLEEKKWQKTGRDETRHETCINIDHMLVNKVTMISMISVITVISVINLYPTINEYGYIMATATILIQNINTKY